MNKFDMTTRPQDHVTTRLICSRHLMRRSRLSLSCVLCLAFGRLHARAEIPAPAGGDFTGLALGHRDGSQSQSQSNAVPAADIGWRDFFRDPRLQQLIELALTNNPDLRVAMLNVDQTRALYRVQRNALVPTVDVNANGSRQRISTGFGGGNYTATFNQFNVNLGVASYELDLFGRVRSLKKQALETYFATEEAQKSAQIALVAEVGAAYLTEREMTEQLAVARQTLRVGAQHL